MNGPLKKCLRTAAVKKLGFLLCIIIYLLADWIKWCCKLNCQKLPWFSEPCQKLMLDAFLSLMQYMYRSCNFVEVRKHTFGGGDEISKFFRLGRTIFFWKYWKLLKPLETVNFSIKGPKIFFTCNWQFFPKTKSVNYQKVLGQSGVVCAKIFLNSGEPRLLLLLNKRLIKWFNFP